MGLHRSELPPEFREPRSPAPTKRAVNLAPEDDAERIRRALQDSGGEVNRDAKRVGMGRTTSWRKRKRLGI